MGTNNFTRRSAAIGTVAGGLVASLPMQALAQARETRAIRTSTGRVRGKRIGGVSSFWGIPYGADTAARRFQPAVPPPAWIGVRACFTAGAQAPQAALFAMPPNAGSSPALQAVLTIFGAGGGDARESEDCLFLNVFTPDPSRARKRPVMFWLHGGGFASGSGGIASYDGSALCRRGDVVVVTINHRLNAMGHLYLGALHDDFANSGNVGQLDQVLALQWVRDNIENFGGDPNCVMIFGESGGGSKVSTLLAMPPAHGLFHKGVIQSGPGLRMIERAAAAEHAERTLSALGVARADVHRMQSLDYRAIIEAATAGGGVRMLSPVVDGRSLPRHPCDPDAPAISRDVPVIVGSNKDEATLFMVMQPGFGTWSEAEAQAQFNAQLGPRGAEAYALFRRMRPQNQPTHLVTSLVTARGTWMDSIRHAERKAANNAAPAYMYRLDWETPILGGVFKNPHGLDVALVFDNANTSAGGFLGNGPEPAQIAAVMSQAWINFARTGDPSQEGLAWPRYDAAARQTMIFDVNSHLVADPDREARTFFAASA